MKVENFLKHFPNTVIQFFDDDKKRHDGRMAKITSYNQNYIDAKQKTGCGVFFSVNGFRPGTRKIKTLTNINGLFVDMDVAKEGEKSNEELRVLKNAKKEVLGNKSPLSPHFVIETKNGLQAIWLVKDIRTVEEFQSLENGLIEYFGADEGAKDVARVLRLPDTLHQKNPEEKFLCELITDNSANTKYRKEDVANAFNVMAITKKAEPESQMDGMPKVYNTPSEIGKACEIPLEEVMIWAGKKVKINIEFKDNPDGSKQIIENGEITSGYKSKFGDFCYSSSGKNRKGNQITAAEYYLKEIGGININRVEIAKMINKELLPGYQTNDLYSKFMPLKDFLRLDLPKPGFLVDQIIPNNGINIVMGEPGSYKTWFCLYMIKCINNGEPVLGQHQTKQTNILLINVDDPLNSIKDRLDKMKINGDGIFIWNGSEFSLTDSNGDENKTTNCLARFVENEKIGLVVMDTFRDVHELDENDSMQMKKLMSVFNKLIGQCNVSFILIHHESKNKDNRYSQNALRGSTAINGSACSVIQLKEDRKNKSIKITQYKNKIAKKIEPFNMVYVEDEEMGNHFEITETPKNDSTDEIKEKILNYFKENPEPNLGVQKLVEELRKSVKASKNDLKIYLEELEKESELNIDQERNQRNRKIYRLTENNEEELTEQLQL